jgi:hypothetical protein
VITAATVEEVRAAADEVRLLWPALVDALPRDQGTGSGRRGGAPLTAIPVNEDVADTLQAIATGAIVLEHTVAVRLGSTWLLDLLGTPYDGDLLDALLRAAPPAYRRLTATNAADHALTLADTIHGWQHTLRRALRLSQRPIRLGQDCPVCTIPTPLLAGGAEGTLAARRRLADPSPTTDAIAWRHSERIWCPACATEWPRGQWRHLGHVLDGKAILDAYAIGLSFDPVIPAGTIRRWASEGLIERVGRDSAGRTLYRHGQVAAVRDRLAQAAEAS